MPPPVTLPKTYRPVAARIVAFVAGGSLVAVIAAAWIALPAASKDQFDWFQRATLLLVFAAGLSVLWGVARCRLVANKDGVRIVNIFKSRSYAWAEVVDISMSGSAPWATVDLANGTATNVMAVQAVDGQRSARAVREIAGFIALMSTTDHDN
jgi:hypothetical protein